MSTNRSLFMPDPRGFQFHAQAPQPNFLPVRSHSIQSQMSISSTESISDSGSLSPRSHHALSDVLGGAAPSGTHEDLRRTLQASVELAMSEGSRKQKIARLRGLIRSFDRVLLAKDARGRVAYPEWISADMAAVCEVLRQLAEDGDDVSIASSESEVLGARSRTPHAAQPLRQPSVTRAGSASASKAADMKWTVNFRDPLPFLRDRARGSPVVVPKKQAPSARSPPPPPTPPPQRQPSFTPPPRETIHYYVSPPPPTPPSPKLVLVPQPAPADPEKDRRLQSLELTVDQLSQMLNQNVHAHQSREQLLLLEKERLKDDERQRFLALLRKLDDMDGALAEQRKRVSELQDDQSRLAREAAEKDRQTRQEIRQLLEDQNKELLALRSEKDQLATRLTAELDRALNEMRNLESRNAQLSGEVEGLKKQLSDALVDRARAADQLSELLARNSVLEKTNFQIREEMRQLTADLKAAKDREKANWDAHNETEKTLKFRLDEAERREKAALDRAARAQKALEDKLGEDKAPPPFLLYAKEKLKILFLRYTGLYYRDNYRKQLAGRIAAEQVTQTLKAEIARMQQEHIQELRHLRASHDDNLQPLHSAIASGQTAATQRERELLNEIDALARELAETKRVMRDSDGRFGAIQAELRAKQAEIERVHAQWERERKANFCELEFIRFGQFFKSSFQGDYLLLRDNTAALHVIYSQGDEDVLFSGYAETHGGLFNRKSQHVIAVTSKAVYVLSRKLFALERKVRMADIKAVSLSRRNGALLVLHHAADADLLLEIDKRAEVMYHLMKQTELVTGRKLAYKFGERVFVQERNALHSEVIVEENASLRISAPSFLAPDSKAESASASAMAPGPSSPRQPASPQLRQKSST